MEYSVQWSTVSSQSEIHFLLQTKMVKIRSSISFHMQTQTPQKLYPLGETAPGVWSVDMQMVDRRNTNIIGEDRKTLTFMHQSIPAVPIPPPGLTPGH